MADLLYPNTKQGEVIDLTFPWKCWSASTRIWTNEDQVIAKKIVQKPKERIGPVVTIKTNYIGDHEKTFGSMSDEEFDRTPNYCIRHLIPEFRYIRRQRWIQKALPFAKSERVARKLLRKIITPEQWATFKKHGSFIIEAHERLWKIAGYGGVLEYIKGTTYEELIADPKNSLSKVYKSYCLHTSDKCLPHSDVLIQQYCLIRFKLNTFQESANMDLGLAHPNYDEANDPYAWEDQDRFMALIMERNNGIDPRTQPSLRNRLVGPPYILPRLKDWQHEPDREEKPYTFNLYEKDSEEAKKVWDIYLKLLQIHQETNRKFSFDTLIDELKESSIPT